VLVSVAAPAVVTVRGVGKCDLAVFDDDADVTAVAETDSQNNSSRTRRQHPMLSKVTFFCFMTTIDSTNFARE
jgi:hypothetical protein